MRNVADGARPAGVDRSASRADVRRYLQEDDE
jgi:hypothetical protein